MAERLVTVAKKLNVGLSSIVEFLASKGHLIENKPTAVVSDEIYDVLTQGLNAYLAQKDAAGQFVIGKGNGFVKKNDIPFASDVKSKEVNLINELPNQIFADELSSNKGPLSDNENDTANSKTKLKVIGAIDLSRPIKGKIKEVMEEHPEIKLWKNFIEANQAIIKEKERPFKVGIIESLENVRLRGKEIVKVKIELIKYQKYKLIEKAVLEAGISSNHYRYDDQTNLLYLPINVTTEQIENINNQLLKAFDCINQKDQKAVVKFKMQPSLSGSIEVNDTKYKEINELLNAGKKNKEPNVIHSTFDEINIIDQLEKEYNYIKRDKVITAILKVNYFDNNKIIEKYINSNFGVTLNCNFNWEKSICSFKSKVLIGNLNEMLEKTGLTPVSNEMKSIVFVVTNKDKEKEIVRIRYCFNNHDLAMAIELPKLRQQYESGNFMYYEYKYEITEGNRNNLNQFLQDQLWEYANFMNEIGYMLLLKPETKILSFDFLNKDEFLEKYKVISKDGILNTIYDSKLENTAFKIRLAFTPPELNRISFELKKKFEKISIKYNRKGSNLIYRLPYSSNDEMVKIKDCLFELKDYIKVTYHNDPHYKSYYCEIDLDRYEEIIKDKINLIRNTEMYYTTENNRKILIGNLISVNSDTNELMLHLNEKRNFEDLNSLYQGKTILNTIIPDLTGDKKKNEYLKQALNKIIQPIDEFNGRPVNGNIRNFIFDSTKADHLSSEELCSGSENWQNVINNLYSKNINEPQIASVVKAVYSQDLALLQGPPGTGKTTVIAEIIWQLLSIDPQHKILLTSESNLAVDNALERLKSNETNLMKPIRLGNNVQDEEGLYFHIDRIDEWSRSDYSNELRFNSETLESEDLNNNVVCQWMKRIALASEKGDNEDCEVLLKWRNSLKEPNKALKTIFKESYYNNVNVIGNTCSAAGSPSFLQSYQDLYNIKDIEIISKDRIIEKDSIVKYYYTLKNNNNKKYFDVEKNLDEVVFDTVIMDEASKATPPELLLPLCYGNKNIIIGDHRQLPPTLKELDDEGFQTTLEEIGETNLALEWQTKAEMKVSQFKKLISKAPKEIIGVFNLQYRMHPQINNVISQFYKEDGGLNPGQELIENCELHYKTNHPLSRHHGLRHEGFIEPDIHTLWVNVDEPERKDGFSYVNDGEVEAIRRVLNYIKKSDGYKEYTAHWVNNNKPEENEIGVISFYAKQLAAMKIMLNQVSDINVRLKTVDRFQGMERNIIIVSTVRSNKKIEFPNQIQNFEEYSYNNGYSVNKSLGFAKSPERINVALSRAKRLLIIVGNSDHFSANPIYKNVIETIKSNSSGNITFIDYKSLNLY